MQHIQDIGDVAQLVERRTFNLGPGLESCRGRTFSEAISCLASLYLCTNVF